MTRAELKEKANDLPLTPGVYLMMDKTGKVIYVGKAKKLKNRVSQYFQDSAAHTAKTRQMVSQVDHFDTIFVSSEFEALVLDPKKVQTKKSLLNYLIPQTPKKLKVVFLYPRELIQQYQEKRASLNADIDRILEQITGILGISNMEDLT